VTVAEALVLVQDPAGGGRVERRAGAGASAEVQVRELPERPERRVAACTLPTPGTPSSFTNVSLVRLAPSGRPRAPADARREVAEVEGVVRAALDAVVGRVRRRPRSFRNVKSPALPEIVREREVVPRAHARARVQSTFARLERARTTRSRPSQASPPGGA
jgi:hypothetical protein